jgi:cell division protein ZapA
MTQTNSHRVIILGREFQVRSHATPERVAEIEQFVKDRLEAIQTALPLGDVQSVVSLALLNLAGEYLSLQDECSGRDIESVQRLTNLISRVDIGLK